MRYAAQSQPPQRAEVTPSTRGSTRVSPIDLERFDEYLMVAKLGQGGMAEVFLGLAQGPSGFRKLHVVKRLHGHMNEEPELVAMFLHEAALAARLHHPNVVQTNKVGSFRGQHFLAMEYLDGQPLNRILKRLQADAVVLPPALAARIVSDALSGLDYAHRVTDYDGAPLGIVHRDVSPHNIFVTYDGQVKLLDFGIAKASTIESHTRTGLIKGKCSYIAPEQARGEAVDLRADLWSMGVTLWECIAGKRPFRGQTDIDILRSTLSDEIPLLTEVAENVPEELAHTLHHVLQRDPHRRLPTALAFKDELDSWLWERGEAGTNETLAALMQALFVDKIEERRAVLRACMSRVAELERERDMGLGAHGELHVAPDADEVPPSRLHDKPKWAVVLALVLTTGALTFALRPTPERASTAAQPALVTPVQNEPYGLGESEASHRVPRPPNTRVHEGATLEERAVRPSQPDQGPVPAKPLGARPGARARTREHSAESAASTPSPATADVVASPDLPAAIARAPGRLVLDSTPYAIVFLGELRLGITPIDVELPAATHTLTLRNPEHKLETTYRVTVPSGERIARRIALD
jgi:tRNA A-37 threonylcarbamoyl transferase component Bud32